MELLLDNLKNALFKGKHRTKAAVIPEKRLLIRIAVIGGLSLLIGRAALCYSLEPCAIALITVLMAKSKANIYALPLICFGMVTAFGTGYDYFGDMIAIVCNTVVFFILGTKKLTLIIRALIAGFIMVLTKIAYYLFAGLFFLFDGLTVAIEVIVLFIFIYVFYEFFSMLENRKTSESKPIEIISVYAAVIMVSAAGLGVIDLGPVSHLHIIALLLTLIIGNNMGPAEGALTGILTGVFMIFAAFDTPALAGILGCCGVIAGLFMGQGRIVAGICFGGLALSFGLIKGYPGLYLSIYEPLIAAAIYILIPPKFVDIISKWFSEIKQDDNYYELKGRRRVKEQLKDYRDVFHKLALYCSSFGEYNPARDIAAQQFKGLANSLERIGEDLTLRPEPIVQRVPKYELQLGVASYAIEGKVSGDSYLCTNIREGEYLIALSDGMGRGVRAAEESTLTVNILHNLLKAGFEAELALKMVNSILLLNTSEEVFSTVDMGFINLYTGRARFFKVGAATSFIKRDGTVKSIKVSALPMGIIERIPVESISLQLRRGDQIIIVSDGIADADRGEDGLEWVKESISEIRSKDPQTMADLILNKAIQRYGLREKDDMTVISAIVI